MLPSSPAKTPLPSFADFPPFAEISSSRLQALYSDFSRQKHSNPTSFHANVEWWRKTLEFIVTSGLQQPIEGLGSDRLVFHANRSLIECLKMPRAGKPLALGSVISELCTSKSLIPISDFLNARKSIYDPGWLPVRIASYVVGRPLWWALEQMGVVGEDGIISSGSRSHHTDTSWWGDYVFLSLLERAAEAVMEMQQDKMGSPADALYSWDTFKAEFAGVAGGNEALRDADTKMLVKFLEREKNVVSVDKEVIKFVSQNASAEQRTISAVDRGILELKTAVHHLHKQLEAFHNKIDECTRKASSAFQQKRKPVALSYIRSRKQLEELVNKRLGSLSTLEATLITVETAAADIEIMKTYESSTATLRAILAHPSLQRSSIDKTMEALAEANADARELDDAVRISGDLALGIESGIDDDELEAELQTLAQEAEAEKNAEDIRRKLEETTKVPTETPVQKETTKIREPIVAS